MFPTNIKIDFSNVEFYFRGTYLDLQLKNVHIPSEVNALKNNYLSMKHPIVGNPEVYLDYM